MYIYGSFLTQQSETVTVHIVTKGDRTQILEIGTEEADIYFGDNPVEISDEVNDTFDVLLRKSATVTLLCGNLVTDFFSTSCRDAIINVYKGDKCVFAGFIEPQTFSQSYNERWDEMSLNCIDALSALQYSKYKNIGSSGVIYSVVKAEAKQRSFYDILLETMNGVTSALDIVNGGSATFLYDGSKAVDAQTANRYKIFSQLSISELLFLGDEEDDVWQQDEVLEEMLKYLNLHLVQDGLTFYIFSWETVKRASGKIIWHDIESNDASTTTCDSVVISLANVADCGTTVSIGDTYNQLQLTANITEMEDVIESPLDDDLLVSPYTNKQKYTTEYSCDGEGFTAYNAFYALTHEQATTYGEGKVTDWFVQVMQNTKWTFPLSGNPDIDIVDYFCGDGKNQHKLPDWLGQNSGACILSLGSVQTCTANDDNSPTSKVDMANYMVVSVNGNEIDNDENKTRPSVDDIKKNIPYAIYNGNTAGGSFSPVDDETTNYLVLSGSVILNPIMTQTNTYTNLHYKTWTSPADPTPKKDDEIKVWHQTVPSRNNEDGRYYTRKYWQAETPRSEATWHEGADSGFCPYTGEGPQQYEFKYSAIGDGTDTISKVSVLACMLVIGDKCVVETGTDGQPSDFKWQTYKDRSECADDDEYYQQCFTIGFDPKIGDKLIGTEFDIQNNISYTMGIDAEGIAIPIKKSDKVSGAVQFKILGPVNVTWDVVTRRHPTWFRHTKWSSTSVPLMAHVSSIMLKEFEIKVYSDNGFISDGNDDCDIVYMSDTVESFINKKDDLEFKINSALTSSECAELGVQNKMRMSVPVNVSTGDGVTEIYDRNAGAKAKPEQLYVDSYYQEYHEPRVLMVQNLMDSSTDISLFYHYRHDAMGKDFFVQGVGRNLIEGTASLTLKEIDA